MQIKNLRAIVFGKTATADVLRHATRRVTAHSRFGTVGIKDAHFEINAFGATIVIHQRHNHHTIGTDTETAVAKLNYPFCKSGAVFRRLPRFITRNRCPTRSILKN